MTRNEFAPIVAALALALGLSACSGNAEPATSPDQSSASQSVVATTPEDGSFFVGMWRGSVELSADSPYGNVTGKEQMLDVYINEDGTCSIAPLEGHEDLLTEEGTWTADGDTSVTLTFPSATVTLSSVDDITLTGPSESFGVDGFDEMQFNLY